MWLRTLIKDDVMKYNVGNYRYNNGKIYKQVWWFLFKCIDEGPYNWKEGVKRVNFLAGIRE